METDYEVTIDRPAEEVFTVLAAVERYHEWLPASDTYVRTEIADPSKSVRPDDVLNEFFRALWDECGAL